MMLACFAGSPDIAWVGTIPREIYATRWSFACYDQHPVTLTISETLERIDALVRGKVA